MDGRRISLEQEMELLARIQAGQNTREISRQMKLARETIEARRGGRVCPVVVDRYWCRKCSAWVKLAPCPACGARALRKRQVRDDEEEDIRLELGPEEQARANEIRKGKIAKGESIPRVGKMGSPHSASARDLGLSPDINTL